MKMKTHLGALLLLVVVTLGGTEKVDYTGYKLVRIFPRTEQDLQGIESLKALGANQLMHFRDHDDFLIPPRLTGALQILSEKGIQLEIFQEDVQKLINSQKVNTEKIVNGSLDWDRYYNLTDIYQFLDDQAQLHNSFASTFSIGRTYEGREMKAIKISKSRETKPAIFIESNIHAREWITGAVCTFVIDQLLNSNDTEIQAWLDEYDFYILPVMNADGYEYTHTTDRYWRKSRRNNNGSSCVGTDLNRNFDWGWMENGGGSSDPCSQVYAGPSPFSDNETANLRDFLYTIQNRLVFFLSLHSAGQVILFPTGYNATRIPQYNTYMNIGRLAAAAHEQKFDTEFTPGSVYDLMYVATGITMDWVKAEMKTNLTITYELRDKGQFGHVLPPDQILPSGLEFMDGLKAIMGELSKGIPDVDP